MKCDLCGKFRKELDIRLIEGDSNDGHQGQQWIECKFCMSKSELERFNSSKLKQELTSLSKSK